MRQHTGWRGAIGASIAAGVAVLAPQLLAARPMQLHDLWTLRTITSVGISPDARNVLFAVTPEKGGGGDELKMLNVAAGTIEPVDLGPDVHRDRFGADIVWSARGDGLIFMRDTDAEVSFWQWDLASQESRRLFAHPAEAVGLAQHAQSPDGRFLAYVVAADSSNVTQARRKEALASAGLVLDAENRPAYSPDTKTEIWIWNRDTRDKRRVWVGPDVVQLLWSPQSTKLAVQFYDGDVRTWSSVASRGNYGSRLVVLDPWSTWQQELLCSEACSDWISGWAPDGRSLAVDRGNVTVAARSDQGMLGLVSGYRVILWSFDRRKREFRLDKDPLLIEPGVVPRMSRMTSPPSADFLYWSREGTVYHSARAARRTSVINRARPGKPSEPLTPREWSLTHVSFASRAPMAAAVRQTAGEPPELALIDLRTGGLKTLTSLNAPVAALERPRVEPYAVTNRFGYITENWLIRPAAARGGTKCPLVLLSYSFNNVFNAHPWMKNYAPFEFARLGMCVLLANYPDYDGVAGEGRRTPQERWRFGVAVNALASFEAAVDQLAAEGVIDPARVGISGFSYGGFLTQYAITHSSKFSVAFVNDGGAWNPGLYYFSGIRDASYTMMYDFIFGGAPYGRGSEAMRAFLPAYRFGGLALPVLFEGHGGEEALPAYADFFLTARQEGTPIEGIIYKGTHILTDRQQQLTSIARGVDWFRYWLLDSENPDALDKEQYLRWQQLRRKLTRLRSSE